MARQIEELEMSLDGAMSLFAYRCKQNADLWAQQTHLTHEEIADNVTKSILAALDGGVTEGVPGYFVMPMQVNWEAEPKETKRHLDYQIPYCPTEDIAGGLTDRYNQVKQELSSDTISPGLKEAMDHCGKINTYLVATGQAPSTDNIIT